MTGPATVVVWWVLPAHSPHICVVVWPGCACWQISHSLAAEQTKDKHREDRTSGHMREGHRNWSCNVLNKDRGQTQRQRGNAERQWKRRLMEREYTCSSFSLMAPSSSSFSCSWFSNFDCACSLKMAVYTHTHTHTYTHTHIHTRVHTHTHMCRITRNVIMSILAVLVYNAPLLEV